jgi:hypothetical protein
LFLSAAKVLKSGLNDQPNPTGAKRTGAMHIMAEIRAQHDTSARKCDTPVEIRANAQHTCADFQATTAGLRHVSLNFPTYSLNFKI